ncbi:MAG: hypothetical protein M1829_003615 [Trizodia sp. TS-e1964]|nr:MAG: hypothetical protein M1829_003615 [Trizodia sp. TS-e1964]
MHILTLLGTSSILALSLGGQNAYAAINLKSLFGGSKKNQQPVQSQKGVPAIIPNPSGLDVPSSPPQASPEFASNPPLAQSQELGNVLCKKLEVFVHFGPQKVTCITREGRLASRNEKCADLKIQYTSENKLIILNQISPTEQRYCSWVWSNGDEGTLDCSQSVMVDSLLFLEEVTKNSARDYDDARRSGVPMNEDRPELSFFRNLYGTFPIKNADGNAAPNYGVSTYSLQRAMSYGADFPAAGIYSIACNTLSPGLPGAKWYRLTRKPNPQATIRPMEDPKEILDWKAKWGPRVPPGEPGYPINLVENIFGETEELVLREQKSTAGARPKVLPNSIYLVYQVKYSVALKPLDGILLVNYILNKDSRGSLWVARQYQYTQPTGFIYYATPDQRSQKLFDYSDLDAGVLKARKLLGFAQSFDAVRNIVSKSLASRDGWADLAATTLQKTGTLSPEPQQAADETVFLSLWRDALAARIKAKADALAAPRVLQPVSRKRRA